MADLPRHLDPDAPPAVALSCTLTVRTDHGPPLGVTEKTMTVRAGTDTIVSVTPAVTVHLAWPAE